MQYTAEDILIDREKRVRFQETIIKRFNMPLVTVRVNYPGVNKENDITTDIIKIMDKTIVNSFKDSIICKIYRITAEGPILCLVVEGEVKEIKKKAIEIEENHIVGRCVDIDVYDEFGVSFSREKLGKKPRKCFICDKDARSCVRERKHSYKEVSSFIINKYGEYKSTNG